MDFVRLVPNRKDKLDTSSIEMWLQGQKNEEKVVLAIQMAALVRFLFSIFKFDRFSPTVCKVTNISECR